MQVGRAWQGPAGTRIVYRDAECVAQIRCDRATALGNPYVMGDEAQRDAVCDAFESLFHDNLVGLWGVFVVGTGRYVPTLLPTVGNFDSIVSLIGESAGFDGVVERWDPCAARRELTRLHDLMVQGRIEICCHCAPGRCHLDTVARYLTKWYESRFALCDGTHVVV